MGRNGQYGCVSTSSDDVLESEDNVRYQAGEQNDGSSDEDVGDEDVEHRIGGHKYAEKNDQLSRNTVGRTAGKALY